MMKNFTTILLLAFTLLSCKKTIESIQENLIVKAMTDGQWKVTRYVRGGTEVTSDFSPYKFQFHSNNTVDAINNVSTESTGSWNADAASRTITSSFSTATSTVSLLNGTWQITNNSWTFVEATQTVNGEVRTLRLDK